MARASAGALAALQAMRLYHGLRSDIRARPADEAKLKQRAERACAKEAKRMGVDPGPVWDEVEREALKRGPLTPLPGKDI